MIELFTSQPWYWIAVEVGVLAYLVVSAMGWSQRYYWRGP